MDNDASLGNIKGNWNFLRSQAGSYPITLGPHRKGLECLPWQGPFETKEVMRQSVNISLVHTMLPDYLRGLGPHAFSCDWNVFNDTVLKI